MPLVGEFLDPAQLQLQTTPILFFSFVRVGLVFKILRAMQGVETPNKMGDSRIENG